MDATILMPAHHSARFRSEWRSLVELLRSRAETEGHRKLYTFLSEGATPDRSLTYAELDQRARTIGACLQDVNARGQRVLLLFPPGLDYIAAFFGCLYANAIAVPAYPPRQNRNLDRLRKVVYDARPAIALTTQTVMTEIESGLAEYPDLKALKWIAADQLASYWSWEWRDLNPDPSTLAFLQYTSGSTGNPKGVMVSHGNLLHNEGLIQRAFGQSPSSIIVGWLPLFHDMGLIGNVIQPLYAAAECVLFSPMSFLQRPFRWLETISTYRATTSGGPNFAYDLCVRKIKPEERETLDLSSWTVAFNGAEPVRTDTLDRFCAAFEPCGFRREAFFPCYGLAEATLFVSGGPGNRKPVVREFQRAALDQHQVAAAASDEKDVRSLVGCGYAPEHQVVIADPESHAVCKRGHVGEVWVSSESVAQGYWNQTEESDRIFRAHLDTGDGPYLRTGDLGFIDGGQLYVTGRLKDLIIIRGRNCYPEDIEHTLGHCHRALRPGEGVVFSADIEGEERLIVVHEVARDYRGNDLPKVVDSIRSRVAEEHDLQLFHVALIQTGTLLRTSSGKIRRQAMKKVFLEGKIRVLYQWQYSQQQEMEIVAPAALDLEAACEWIAVKVAAVVGVTRDQIDCNKPIVQYGMDSLASMELAHSIEANLGAVLPVTTLLSDLSISEIAQRVLDQCGRADDRITVQPAVISPEIAFPLSEGQAALWFLHRLAPQSAAYNVVGGARLRGEVDVAGLQRAFQALVDRHPILRARFEARGGQPVQVIQENVTLFFHEDDVSSLSEDDLRARVAVEARRPFDLEHGPLIRLALFTRAGGDRLLMLVAHHIVIDMWSVAVLVSELKSIYEAAARGGAATLPPLEFSYRDFVIWQQQELAGPQGQQLQQYWQKELSGELPVLNLNTDHSRPYLQTFEGASESIRLDNKTVNQLQELARANVLSTHSLLLAAYAALLYRHTNQEEVIVGCPVSGRTDRRFQSLVGYFVNPAPVRIRLNERMTFRQLLAEVRETVQRALTHQAYPFARIVEDVCSDRDPSRSPVFQTTFVFEQPPHFIDRSLSAFVLGEEQAQLSLGPLALESVKIDQAISQFDLSMLVAPFEEDLLVALQYNTSLFEPSTIKKMLGHFSVLLDEVAARPDQRILDLPVLTKEEQQQLLVEFNDTHSDYTRHDYVHQLFEAQVKKTPRAVAVKDDAGAISYGELNAKANRLAHHLRASGVGPDSRVAILLPRSLDMIAAMLAVLKAGGAYVPLDPAYPADRLSFMLEDSEASVVICHDTLARHLAEHRAKIINLNTDEHAIARQSRKNPWPRVKPENLSHVIYTSGSTGRPKGVAIEHRNVIHFLHWAHQTFTPEELSGVLAATSICFDLSVFEIFAPLTCGGTIILANDALHLATHSAATSVTLINTVPSAMTGLLRLGAVGPNVLTVNLAGEALKSSLVQQIHAETNVRRVLNLYGPTEYTTYTTGVEVKRGSESEPTIGKPIANTRVYILNENGGPVPVGVAGEICIGGQGLARCYLNRPEMTAERFIPDHLSLDAGSRLYRTGDVGRYLENGEIEYLGRIDHQIKLRGYRIELGEIESALLRYPGIKEAVVVAKEDHAGEKQLVAYLVNELDQHAGNDELRNYLRQTLPGFMVPQFFVTLAQMPLTSNGKVDRLSLPDPQEVSLPHCVRPLGPIEEVVASIWAEVLGVEQIGATTNFFDTGGQSLKAVQVVARLSELLQVELPVTTVFEAPTVEALASVVERSMTPERRVAASPIERVSRNGSLPLSFAQQRLWFLQRLEPSSAAYNISFSARFVGPVNLTAIEQSINEIVRRHESLRTTFAEVDSVPVQVIAPELTVLPVIIDLADRNESETECRRLRREEARRPFDLENGPLLRTMILRLSADECVVSLSLHHAISDGWSGGVFIRELIGFYEAFSTGQSAPLPALTVQYADFAHWQRQQLQQDDFQSQLSYWRKQLSAAPPLELPARTRPAVRTEEGSVLRFDLPGELVQELRALSRRNGATLFMTLLATLQVLLSRYSSQTDISVGTPVANRTSAEIEPLIGCFVNTLVMRTDLSGNPTFRELLGRVRDVALGGYTHSAIPFERLVSELQPDRDLSRTPLFQVMMVLQNTPQQPLVLGDLHCRIEEIDNGTAKFDLLVQLTESEAGLDGKWEYSTDLFDANIIEQMVTHFRALLERVVEDEHRHISEIPILTDEEQSQLRRFNETQQDVTPDAYLHQSFEAQVEKTPDAIALVHETGNLTYQDLNRRANRLAHYLQTLSVGPETRVALLLKRSPELLVSMLAVLKAGGAYLPLDPAYPAERLSFMLEDAGASVLICRAEPVDTFAKQNVRVVDLAYVWPLIAEQSSDNPVSGVSPTNLSHVIYTSGSTGRPKGVAIEHRSVISFLQWARNTFSKEELDGVCASTSICFDLSVFEIFAPLSGGGTVVLADDALHLAMHTAADRVTLINTVPSAMVELLRLQAVGEEVLSVNLAGETLKRSLVQDIYSQTGVGLVRNLYGPTEYTTYSTAEDVERECEGEPSIGRPLANTQIYILDQALALTPPGVAGEIFIGGHGLARGYLNRPDLTADRFLPDTFSNQTGSRLYRTGDLGKYLPDGSIEYLGRKDHQVKVRGYRIELGEIETALEQHESIREAVVIAGGEAEAQRLVAYVVSARESIEPESYEAELRHSLHQRLPGYMAPSIFVFLDRLPLTANGKVDRRALPAPERLSREGKEGFVAGRTVTEQLLVQIWSEVLKVEPIGIHDDFFALGGHSLMAAQVVSRIRATFQIELPLRSLFETPTIESLAQAIESQAETAIIEPIARVSRKTALPLSFAQQRLWFLNQLDPNNSAYNLSMVLRLEGPLNNSALEKTLDEIVQRHEVLRTRFVADDGPPRQVIEHGTTANLVTIDLTGLPPGRREEDAQSLFAAEAQRHFNFSESRLLRLMLLKLEDDKHWLVLVAHHIIADGWSVGIFTRELTQLYSAFSRGEDSSLSECAIQYADFAAWQRNWLTGERLTDELSYWKEQLSDAPALLELPTDQPRPAVQTFRGADVSFSLSSTLTSALQSLCRTHAVTPFMALSAAFAMLLSRYSRQSDVCIGTPVAGRTRLETEDLIGLFVNTLVLRTRFNGELTFRDLLAQVREVTLQADAHQYLPFEKLVDELQPERTLSYSPLFQAMFVLQDTPAEELDIHGLSLSRIDAATDTAQFDLTMRIEERAGEFTGRLNYNTDLFERATIERMTRHFLHLLGEMVRDPQQQVADVKMLSTAEREQLIVEWNRLEQQDEVDGLMPRFERAVQRNPDAIALKDGDEAVSYRELNRRANQLGHYLRRQHGVGPEVRVGLLLDRSVEMIVSILGVLKAGGAYVPMELSAPAERIAYMLEDSGCALLLTEKEQFDLVGENAARPAQILALDELSQEIAAEPESNPDVPVSADNLAYMIYTSGSTGKPKGVMVTHGNVLRLLDATDRWYGFGGGDVWTMFHSYAFDVSVWELWGSLLFGGRLVVVPYWVSRTPEAYYELLQREQVTVLNQTPSAFRQVQPLLEQGSAGQLRLVIFAGEALELNSLKSWYERFGDEGPQLVNMYGITETTVHSTYRPLRQADVIEGRGSMVGRRIPDLEIYLLDERQEPAPVGVPGELYVGGAGVARGYLNRPELTAERFIAHPFSATGERLYRSGDLARYLEDGDIEYLGRIDHQVKIRGYRIETGEIESVLASYPGVRKAVVIPREFESGHKYLAAYVTGDGGPGTDGLRNYLEAKLPAYMVPSALMWVDSIKLTTNGKIDRRSLPEPARDSDDKAYVAPGSPTEILLASIWQDVLKVDRVGVNDNFFELGGDSILTTHVVTAAQRAGLHLTPQQLFQQQTIGKLALIAEQAVPAVAQESSPSPKPATTGDPELRWASLGKDEINSLQSWTELSNIEDSYPLTSFQQGILFHILDRPSSGIYLNQQSYTLKGKLDVPAFQNAFNEVVNRHQILRTAFILSGQNGPLQMVFRQVNVPWAMYDWRGVPAAEADEHLALLQQAEYRIGFELSRAPLMRMTLVQRETDWYEFIWSYHLLLLDGVSGVVVFKELLEFYEAFQTGKPGALEPPARYGDYVHWLQKQEQREAEAYWRQSLARFSSPTSLGFDRAEATNGVEQKDYTEQTLLLDSELTTELRSLAASSHLTLNTLVQGAWALLLSRRSGSDDIVFGSTVSGRLAEFPESESTVGLFVNVLPVRVRVPRDATLKTWLSEIQSQQAEARRFEFCALPDIQGWSEVPRGQPLFESVLILQNIPLEFSLSESVGLKVLAIKTTERTNVPLAVIIEPGSQLRFKIVYQRTRFGDVTIERMIRNLQRILTWMSTNSEAALSSLPTFCDDERTNLIESFNQSL
ncbi:MAG TPA: amino acid adenylation domain-containing protein [Pyrinomonadaceae bacterium]|nr:amino acid adenylation domain-containing protein [Pyrinomonadaceae bacterium]